MGAIHVAYLNKPRYIERLSFFCLRQGNQSKRSSNKVSIEDLFLQHAVEGRLGGNTDIREDTILHIDLLEKKENKRINYFDL